MVAAGHTLKPNKRWAAREVFVAWVGDKSAAQARKAIAEAELAEIEAAEKRRDVVPWDEVVAFINRTFSPVREQSLAMPTVMAARVNPADPEHAKAHLTDWVDGFLKHCREHIPTGPEKEDGE